MWEKKLCLFFLNSRIVVTVWCRFVFFYQQLVTLSSISDWCFRDKVEPPSVALLPGSLCWLPPVSLCVLGSAPVLPAVRPARPCWAAVALQLSVTASFAQEASALSCPALLWRGDVAELAAAEEEDQDPEEKCVRNMMRRTCSCYSYRVAVLCLHILAVLSQ